MSSPLRTPSPRSLCTPSTFNTFSSSPWHWALLFFPILVLISHPQNGIHFTWQHALYLCIAIVTWTSFGNIGTFSICQLSLGLFANAACLDCQPVMLSLLVAIYGTWVLAPLEDVLRREFAACLLFGWCLRLSSSSTANERSPVF